MFKMAHTSFALCLVIVLFIHTVHSWNVEEWGDPFLDSRFRKLPKSCTYGQEQWDCVPHSECQGAPMGTCHCIKNYTNPDPPGSDTTKTGLRCLPREEAKISNYDPRWKELFLPCTVDCAASQAQCSKDTGNCVCKAGHIGNPASRYNTCKAVQNDSTTVSVSFIANVLVVLCAFLVMKSS